MLDFYEPVVFEDQEVNEKYVSKIETPMSFSVIKRKNDDLQYKYINEILSDIKVVIKNTRDFYHKDDYYYKKTYFVEYVLCALIHEFMKINSKYVPRSAINIFLNELRGNDSIHDFRSSRMKYVSHEIKMIATNYGIFTHKKKILYHR